MLWESASGPLTYPGGKTEPPTDVFNVAGTWVVGLSLISEDCRFIDPPLDVQGTFQFTQQDDMFFGEEQGAISELLSDYIEGALTVSGLVEPNGDFELFSEKGSAEPLPGCTATVFAECKGNFRRENLECGLPIELSGSCPALLNDCEIEYRGTITKTNTSSGA